MGRMFWPVNSEASDRTTPTRPRLRRRDMRASAASGEGALAAEKQDADVPVLDHRRNDRLRQAERTNSRHIGDRADLPARKVLLDIGRRTPRLCSAAPRKR